MRYIDRTNCKKMSDRGESKEITKMGHLSRTATKIAESKGLGVLKTHWGTYRVIKASGLGAYNNSFDNLAEVDHFLRSIA